MTEVVFEVGVMVVGFLMRLMDNLFDELIGCMKVVEAGFIFVIGGLTGRLCDGS